MKYQSLPDTLRDLKLGVESSSVSPTLCNQLYYIMYYTVSNVYISCLSRLSKSRYQLMHGGTQLMQLNTTALKKFITKQIKQEYINNTH